ncbi:MAG: histidine--tRNA ligase [bacterium]|nr:histidine--tRNA ligase [bacterium]
MSETFDRIPRGTHDILPEDEKYWSFVDDILKKHCLAMGLNQITTPVIDFKSLFIRSVGTQSDIVKKEIYSVQRLDTKTEDTKDKEERDELVLRPEVTAQVARAYIQHGMQTWPQPVRLFYLRQPNFRYERPQAGRYRQHFQFGVESFGSDDPLTDAQLILLLWQVFQDIKLSDNIIFDINTIGCKKCRPDVKKQIVKYYKAHEEQLCDDCRERLKKNPLRVLDCKNPKCQEITLEAPQIIDSICPECQTHFRQILEILDELEIPYNLNPQLVRGLDYYTRTVFEAREETDEKRQSSLVGGGRYDDLVEELGGTPTPAVGFSFGYERIIEKLKEKEIEVPELLGPEVLLVQLGDKAKIKSLPLVAKLNRLGFRTTVIPGKESLRSQLRMADRLGCEIALIIGQREAFDNTIIFRKMKEGVQETIDIERIEKFLIKYFKR